MKLENIGKYSNEKMNKEVSLGIMAFQKKIKLFLKPGRLNYMKFFLAKSTAPVFSTELAWLAYVRISTSPSQAGSVEKIEAADLAKKNFME